MYAMALEKDYGQVYKLKRKRIEKRCVESKHFCPITGNQFNKILINLKAYS